MKAILHITSILVFDFWNWFCWKMKCKVVSIANVEIMLLWVLKVSLVMVISTDNNSTFKFNGWLKLNKHVVTVKQTSNPFCGNALNLSACAQSYVCCLFLSHFIKCLMTCFVSGNRGKHLHHSEFCCTMTTSTRENMLCKCWWRWYLEWQLIMQLTSCRRHIIMD